MVCTHPEYTALISGRMVSLLNMAYIYSVHCTLYTAHYSQHSSPVVTLLNMAFIYYVNCTYAKRFALYTLPFGGVIHNKLAHLQ